MKGSCGRTSRDIAVNAAGRQTAHKYINEHMSNKKYFRLIRYLVWPLYRLVI